ncbi:MAG: NAD(P)-dependent alcohol dehydrogenase [Actinomycetota bacterium]|nr:NAD(P)-dependent alcohol dehydrogenase [Actinomycetota bacterium]
MRAVVHRKYGPPEVLHLVDVDTPTPAANEVLVKVHATTVNRTDTGFRAGKPIIVRPFSGLLRPRRQTLGSEFAGEVAAVGADVTHFAVGDRVFGSVGDRFGANAQFMVVRETAPIALIPDGMSFEEAAAVTDGSLLALNCMRGAGITAGQRVLVYGASGSIGTAAVQLAKHLGTHVTAVCATPNLELARSLGADVVIDYTAEDFTENGEQYDIIFDSVGKHKFRLCRRSLAPKGTYLGTDLGFLCQNPFLALVTKLSRGRRVVFPIPKFRQADVEMLKELLETGHLRPVVDRIYPLEQIVEATRYVDTQMKVGNVVITVA